MRASTSIILCDGDEGLCACWELDYWAQGASTVNGVRITQEAPAPGWICSDVADLCPECLERGAS